MTAETKSLAMLAPPSSPSASPLVPASLAEAEALASTLAKSQMIPDHFKGKVADVFWAIAQGLEVGLPPVASLSGVYAVHGKPGFYADTMVALVLASGRAHYFRRVSSDDTEATYETHRIGAPEPVRLQVTIEYADRAGWTKQNAKYQSEPRRMLEARAKSWLAKDTYQDVLRGISAVEELRDEHGDTPPPAPMPFRAPASVERSAIDVPSTEAPAAPPTTAIPVDEIIADIRSVPSLEALDVAAARAKGVTGAERKRVLAAYEARLKELVAADRAAKAGSERAP